MKKKKIDNDLKFNENDIERAGIDGDFLDEEVPIRKKSGGEKIIQNGNCFIVLGRDREGDINTGYGSSGDTQAYSITLSVGLTKENPDYINDSTTFYISQKSDVDQYFGVNNKNKSKGKSSFAVKSDAVRIISRDGGVEIVTTTEDNSRGGENYEIPHINLRAGNVEDEELQGVVKGENLVNCITEIIEQIDSLNSIVQKVVNNQIKYENEISNHYHFSPFFGKPTTVSETMVSSSLTSVSSLLQEVVSSLITQKSNLANLNVQYLTSVGAKSIKSRYNKVS